MSSSASESMTCRHFSASCPPGSRRSGGVRPTSGDEVRDEAAASTSAETRRWASSRASRSDGIAARGVQQEQTQRSSVRKRTGKKFLELARQGTR